MLNRSTPRALRLIVSVGLTACLISATAAVPDAQAPGAASAPAAKNRAPAGPAPKSKAEAVKWLEAQDLFVGSNPNDGLVSYLTFKEAWSADVVRAYLLAGAVVTKAHSVVDGYALNTAAIMCEGKAAAAEIVKMLLDAGASPNQKDVDGPKATAPMLGVRCIEVLKVLLTAKPDLNIVDVRGFTVMHHALLYGKPPNVAARMVKDAGFDLARWTPSLKEAGLENELTRALAADKPAALKKKRR
jgi:Ankyrin repeat